MNKIPTPVGDAGRAVAPVLDPGAEEYVTTAELCRRLSISRKTTTNHQLTRYALRVGAQWRYNWAAVLAHYARRQTATQR